MCAQELPIDSVGAARGMQDDVHEQIHTRSL